MSDERALRGTRRIAAACLLALAVALLAACGAVSAPAGWQALGSRNQNGVQTLAADPAVGPLLYAGGSFGAVYRVRADGASTPLAGSGIPGDAVVDSVLADPSGSGVLYAGTTSGFYVSGDHGDRWQRRGVGLPASDAADALAVKPQAADGPAALLAGTTQSGIFRSADGGATWTPSDAGLPAKASINTLLWLPSDGTMYAAVDGAGVYASTDGGHSWQARGSGLPKEVFAFAALLSGGSTTLFAGSGAGLFATTDGGAHWSATGGNVLTGRVLALATDPVHAGWLYAGTDSAVYRSQDGGRSWAILGASLNHAVFALVAVHISATQSVVFAAADYLYRDPAFVPPPASPLEVVLSLLMFVGLVVVAAWAVLRNRRMLHDTDRRVRAATAANRAGARPEGMADGARAGGNGHIRGPGADGLNGHRRPSGPRRPEAPTRQGDEGPRPGGRDDPQE